MSALETTISDLRSEHRKRVFAMEQRKRTDLSLGWFLKTVLGWSKNLPDAERDAIAERAAEMIAIGEALAKGKPVKADPVFEEWRPLILATIQARGPFDRIEADATKLMEKLAITLPVWSWVEPIRGFGALGLATIVAEAGDLANYPTVAKLWKRMGLAVMDGVRQGGLLKTAAKADWIAHGYNRQRRSRMWNIGQSLVKGNQDGTYRTIYLARKEYERTKAEAAGLTVAPAGKIPKGKQAEHMSHGHIDKRAQRYMEKRLLRDLWRAWRETRGALTSGVPVSPAETSRDAA